MAAGPFFINDPSFQIQQQCHICYNNSLLALISLSQCFSTSYILSKLSEDVICNRCSHYGHFCADEDRRTSEGL